MVEKDALKREQLFHLLCDQICEVCQLGLNKKPKRLISCPGLICFLGGCCYRTWGDRAASWDSVSLSAGPQSLCTSPCKPRKTKWACVFAECCRDQLTSAGAYISFSCCSRAAWSCSIASWSWASDSSWLVFSSARDNSSLVIFSLTFST